MHDERKKTRKETEKVFLTRSLQLHTRLRKTLHEPGRKKRVYPLQLLVCHGTFTQEIEHLSFHGQEHPSKTLEFALLGQLSSGAGLTLDLIRLNKLHDSDASWDRSLGVGFAIPRFVSKSSKSSRFSVRYSEGFSTKV